MKKEFKYSSEFSINMFLSKYQFLQQTELEKFAKDQNVFTEIYPCNIYFILKRPRLSLDPKYLRVDSGKVELKYFIQIEDEKFHCRTQIKCW